MVSALHELLRDIDSIIQRGAKATTYKFAVLRAMAEWVIEHPLEESHKIPVGWIAYRILPWYVTRGDVQIPQQYRAGRPMIPEAADRIAERAGGPVAFESSWINQRLAVSSELAEIRRTLVQQPLDKLRNLDGKRLDFYDLTGIKAGTARAAPLPFRARTLADFITNDPCTVEIHKDAARILAPLRFVVRDVAIQAWATWSERQSKNRRIRPYILASLQDPSPTRLSTHQFARAFRSIGIGDRCVLSGQRVQELDIDHFIPWSLYPRHDFTNLVPSDRRVNQHMKSDRLPVVTGGLKNRLQEHFTALFEGNEQWFHANPAPFADPATAVSVISDTCEALAEITGRPRFSAS